MPIFECTDGVETIWISAVIEDLVYDITDEVFDGNVQIRKMCSDELLSTSLENDIKIKLTVGEWSEIYSGEPRLICSTVW